MLIVLSILVRAEQPLTDQEWSDLKEKAKNRPRAVLYDNDGDDLGYNPREAAPSIQAIMGKRTTYLNKYPVDTIIYCVSCGAFQQLFVPTKAGELADFNRSDGSNANLTTWLIQQGTDILKLQLEYARKNNMELFAEFRVNDTHDVIDTPEKPCEYFSKWKREHPELLMGSYRKQPPFATWTSYDFTHAAVREKFIAVVTEVAENYELDGIFIDLYRWLGLFKSVAWGREASPAEREMFSDMLRTIRANLERIGRQRKHPILFAIRVPDSVGYCLAIGFDWEGLMKEGVFDMVFPAGNHHLQPWGKSIELCHQYGVKCYPSIDMPMFVNLPRLSRHATESYLARVAAAKQAGADGIFYYNLFNETHVRTVMALNDEAIRYADKRYHISPIVHWRPTHNLSTGEKYNTLPELHPHVQTSLLPGMKRDFVLEFGDDLQALKKEGKPVRAIATMLADAMPDIVEISSNGKVWEPMGSTGDTHRYAVPENALLPGPNTITFRNTASSEKSTSFTIMKGDVLLKGDNQAPWRRIFPGNIGNTSPEAIVNASYQFSDTGTGVVNMIYPLDPEQKVMDITFDLQVPSSDAPEAAMVRLACGGKTEMVTFGQGKVGFLFAGKNLPFDTTQFHSYRVCLGAGKISLFAEGTLLLESPAVMDSSNASSEMRGMSIALPGMNTQSLVLGSLADAGKGVSRWKNVSMIRPAGNAQLKDFAVDVRLSPVPGPIKVEQWDAESPAGSTILSGGKYPWQTRPTVAEISIIPRTGSAKIYFSNGGMMTDITVRKDGIDFPGGIPTLPFLFSEQPQVIRLEGQNFQTKVFINDELVEIPARNVSMTLRDVPKIRDLNEKSQNVIRDSGVVAVLNGDAVIAGMRIKVFPPSK